MVTDPSMQSAKNRPRLTIPMKSPRFGRSISYDSESAASFGEVTKAVRNQAAARSHNTFRPDIYRVSEGYLT